jgi:SRSO17 transposase
MSLFSVSRPGEFQTSTVTFKGWHHHVTLVSVAHGFLTLERLRRPKPAASA